MSALCRPRGEVAIVFPCLQDDRYWPLTAQAAFFRAPAERVAHAVAFRGRRSPWVRSEHASLDEALRVHAPLWAGRAKFILPSQGGRWTTVLDFPDSDFAFWYAARAYFDLGCEFVAVGWAPVAADVGAEAVFAHSSPRSISSPGGWGLLSRRPKRPPRFGEDVRIVQATGLDGHWGFHPSGQPRAFEEPDHYQRRRIAERLPRELLARYAAAVGVAVDDPGWWDGPVITAVCADRSPARRRKPVDPSQTWSTIAELRRLCGYPAEGIPDELVPAGEQGRRQARQPTLDPRAWLFARIGDINDSTRPRPLVTLAEFFEGNDDPGSIGYNLPDHPEPREFYELLSAIAARPEVADVRIEVKDVEDPDGWPSTDTIWIFTAADLGTVRGWFPDRLAPDELYARDQLDSSIEPYEIPPGTRAVAAWYD